MAVHTVLAPNDQFFAGRPFDWDGRLFTTIPEFEAYLRDPQVRTKMRGWAKRVTVHHTAAPTVAQWLAAGGRHSLMGVIRTWRDTNGWQTGPNMIIAPEGIYLASGVDGPGIHAGVCNGDGIGIEVVGNYDTGYWVEPIRSFVFGAVTALSEALGNSASDIINKRLVNGHRECNSPKTCPGKAIDLDRFRKDIATTLLTKDKQLDRQVIGVPQSVTAAQFRTYLAKYGVVVPPVELDRIYAMCTWLEVDAAFLAAVWKQEAFVDDPTDARSGVAVIGGSELQRQTRCPLNIVERDSVRRTVTYNGRKWRAWSTWQLGLMDAVLYLKEVHGAAGRLSARAIIQVHAPASDGNSPETFIANVLTRMNEMKQL